MFLRLFKGTSPGVILLIAFTFAIVWISAFINPDLRFQETWNEIHMPLYGFLIEIFGSGYIFSTILSLSITVLILFLITNFNTSVFFINERTFLPALLYILVVVIFPEYQMLNPALPASLFFLFALKSILAGYQKQGIAYNFFDAGILISTGSLFYANLIWFAVIIFIGIILIRTVTFAEIAVTLLGLITPYLITFGFYYVLGYDLNSLMTLIYNNLFSSAPEYPFSRLTVVVLIFYSLIIFVSIGNIIRLNNSKKIKSRKTFSILIWIFLISVTVYFAVPSVSVEMIWLTGIPVSYFLTHQFIFVKKKIFSEIFFSVIFVLVLLIQAFYIIF